mmetsp:Transcript_13209/g.34313  ORF Transcript_13209/g.34313 Transcript_13209/m.34313 type:complete len:223 (+) Transcript_13209:1691-2359(+)
MTWRASRTRMQTWIPMATCGSSSSTRSICTAPIASARSTTLHGSSTRPSLATPTASDGRTSCSWPGRRRTRTRRIKTTTDRMEPKRPAGPPRQSPPLHPPRARQPPPPPRPPRPPPHRPPRTEPLRVALRPPPPRAPPPRTTARQRAAPAAAGDAPAVMMLMGLVRRSRWSLRQAHLHPRLLRPPPAPPPRRRVQRRSRLVEVRSMWMMAQSLARTSGRRSS